ncbi:FAD-dependent oxidoreductase [Pseudonocardia spirodelae]|uniref:FAD-dependent oxidoreductase n=1 Tax=Pseudonocardia spirodelae TaxID=3133431 RepID=A0ABU8TCL2_9PSEU
MDDVVIVGAGPVGLFLACELGLAGCSVVVLEREPEGPSPWRTAPLGMRGLTPSSVEAFHRRGLLEPLRAAVGAPAADDDPAEVPPLRSAGHFAGIMLDGADVDLGALPPRLPSPATEWLMVQLDDVEQVLARRAKELGVRIVRGAAVTAVEQTAHGAVVTAGGHTLAARRVVGCDGGRSTVRRLAGFDVAGTEPLFTGYVLDADLEDLDVLAPGFNPTPQGMYLRMPAPGHLGIMDFDGGAFDRSRTPTREHLQEVLRRVSGTGVTLRAVRRVSTFTDRTLQATTYRRGNVLLAGDAAHIHSPLGGQGLNTGLGDALNLGWKLAATVQGRAPEGLLDTYEAERHPVAAEVLDWSRAQVALLRPGAPALQEVVRDLLSTRDGTTYVHRRVSGAGLGYDLGPGHPLLGRVAPEFRGTDGTRLADLTADGHGVLLDTRDDPTLRAAAARRPGRIRYAGGPLRDDLGVRAVLLRPDGVVAWVGAPQDDAGADAGFDAAARRWFGPAA